ncbi:unnamed protein product [Closterium sp. Yama58-4]|nr:unnamed protein product [Closterium sp. Yama58-4]
MSMDDARSYAMYADVDYSAAGSVYLPVPSVGSLPVARVGAGVGSCLATSTGAPSADASLSFTLDSGATQCFFRDSTTLTPLSAPVSVALADPSSGPVIATHATTLSCPAAPSGSLTGLHVPTFSRNLVGVAPLARQHVGVWFEPSGDTAVCVDGDTYAPLATFRQEPGSGLYTLHTDTRPVPPSHQVARSSQVAVPGLVAASCSCRSLSHPVLLWHHRLGHPSLSRLRAMSSQRLVLGLPRDLPPLPPSPAPPCGPCVQGRLRATPHSSSLRPASEPFETLHLDVWGPASRLGPERESFFLVVADDSSRYTTVFPLAKKSDVTSTLIRWLLATESTRRRRVSCLHSDRGGEFCSGILARFCAEQGITQSWTLPDSPQQNGVAERRLGLVMEIAHTTMIHARAPHFLWPYAARYAAHQLNLWPRVSRPEASPTSLWTGSPGVASRFSVWGCLALVRDTSADKLSPRGVPCVFLGFLEASSDFTFYHPPSHRFFDSRDVSFDESVPYYVRYPCRGLPVPPPPHFLAPAPPPPAPSPPVPPPVPAPSGVSQATPPPSVPPQVSPPSPQSSSQPPQQPSALPLPATADSEGVGARGEGSGGAGSGGVGVGAERAPAAAARPERVGVGGGAGAGGVSGAGESGAGAGATGGATTGGAGTPPTGTGRAAAGGPRSGGAQPGPVEGGAGSSSSSPDTTPPPHPYPTRYQALLRLEREEQQRLERERSESPPSPPPLAHTWASHPPRARPSSPVTDLRTVLFRPSPPRSPPSVLPRPPESSLTASLSTPVTDYYRTYRPTLSRVLASLVTDPRASPSSVAVLTAAVTDFTATRRLDYATRGLAAPPVRPLSAGGVSALGCDVLEDRQFELEFLAAASPHLCAMLLTPEGDPDAPDIPTPRTYAEAVSGPWASQWRAAMDAEMASYRSTGTYVDEVPPPGANIVDGMWIFKVKRPPGSPPVFKARYVARGFSQREGVDFFQTFAPTPKMTTLWVLLHVAAQRDYELHSLDFSTAFLQGRLHEEIWLRRPPGFTGTFPPGTQWSLRRPVYSLRQAPREWHDTLRSTLSDLGFEPSSADPSLFVRRGRTPFFVLVYVDDLVFATADTAALAEVKSELQKRHTCTDLGELRRYLGLQISRDRAARTITLTQSHMVQQVLQRFGLQDSSPAPTPLAVDHRLTGPFPDEPFEPSGPYAELVGCLMYLMTCTRPDLAFPLSILSRFVATGRHRPVHWAAAKRVAKYLGATSGMGLVLGGTQPVVLTGHCDSSYADDVETQRSTQGYCFSLGSGAVSWRSTRSSSVATSTAEAEIYAGALAAQELRWLTFLLTDLGERPSSAPTLFADNRAMILLRREPRLESRVKHIDVRYFLLRELQRRGQARLDFVASEANTADIFTKALQPCDHRR